MNETKPIQQTEFVVRRLSDAIHVAGKEIDGHYWMVVVVPVLVLAAIYVVWMYRRDSRTVGGRWATVLGVLRCCVYALLAGVFLLPAWQNWEITKTNSKVVLLFDVSGSTAAKDDLPTDTMPVEKLLSRQDKVIRFLSDSQVKFLARLQQKNPVAAYRFGGQLDETPQTLEAKGKQWSPEEWGGWLKPDPHQEAPAGVDDARRAAFHRKVELEALLVNSTNLGDSLLGVINRERNNMLQGIVVVSDGRSTQYSAQTLQEVQTRAQRDKIPIFTIGVGEHREPVNIKITDLLAPDQARPDDKFPIRVGVDGEGLPDREVPVTLHFYKPQADLKKDKPSHDATVTGRFSRDARPHFQVEFPIEAAQLPADLRKTESPGKPELEEGEWKFTASVPRDKNETFLAKEHVTEPVTVNVVKKPLRVLLFASGPSRDFQFARTLFARESDRGRALLSVCLQTAHSGTVQDVPAERLLNQFPTTLHAPGDRAEENKYGNLAEYDLIIAFDPDWLQISPEQMANLERWVEAGGGLIVVTGPVNTFQLTRSINYERVHPLLDLYPVILDDSRIQGLGGLDRSSTDPWRLNFPGATAEMEFLKLDDEKNEPLSGWEEFFTGHSRSEGGKETVVRGFYDYYPVKDKKPSATVIATFADPRARLGDGREQPYLVAAPYKRGRVVYVGSGEMWRLRQYRESYHERFLTKLARYASAGSLGSQRNPSNLYLNSEYPANNPATFEAQLLGGDLQPLPRTEKPRAKIKGPPGTTVPDVDLTPKSGQGADWGGWFSGRLLVSVPGNYEVQLQVPGTSDILRRRFVVKEANPELDNVQPDFVQLRQVSSEAADVLARVDNDGERQRLRTELERTNRLAAPESPGEDRDKLRLFFDLKSAAEIPDCMVKDEKTQRSRGRVEDIWDAGFFIRREPPWKVSYVLLAVIGLLSLEWLIRKLLKLA